MVYLGNSPADKVVLRLQARKSFALGLWIQDQNGVPLDITGCKIRLVVRERVSADDSDDSGNLISTSQAEMVASQIGFARFPLQASELELDPKEYQFSIVLSDKGFTSVIVYGTLEIVQNTEFESTTETYSIDDSFSTSLRVLLREQKAIEVRTGPILPPGAALFTQELERKLLAIYGGMAAEGTLLTADDIADGDDHVMMTAAERLQLANMSLSWGDIQDKPNFGDIITHDATDFLQPNQVSGDDITSGTVDKEHLPLLSQLKGVIVTTETPSGGNPGYLYLKLDA